MLTTPATTNTNIIEKLGKNRGHKSPIPPSGQLDKYGSDMARNSHPLGQRGM